MKQKKKNFNHLRVVHGRKAYNFSYKRIMIHNIQVDDYEKKKNDETRKKLLLGVICGGKIYHFPYKKGQ